MSVDKISPQSTLHNIELTYRTGEERRIEQKLENEHKPVQGEEDIEKVVKGLNEFLQQTNTHIKFELHDELNEYYVTVVDNQTNEVVREIPSKKILDIYAKMTEYIGLFFDKKI